MPLFRIYKPIYECIEDGSKTIEVRNRMIRGDQAVFMCGRRILRKKILKVQRFTLGDGFFEKNWKKIIPKAQNLDGARCRLLEIFPGCEEFYGYFIR